MTIYYKQGKSEEVTMGGGKLQSYSTNVPQSYKGHMNNICNICD